MQVNDGNMEENLNNAGGGTVSQPGRMNASRQGSTEAIGNIGASGSEQQRAIGEQERWESSSKKVEEVVCSRSSGTGRTESSNLGGNTNCTTVLGPCANTPASANVPGGSEEVGLTQGSSTIGTCGEGTGPVTTNNPQRGTETNGFLGQWSTTEAWPFRNNGNEARNQQSHGVRNMVEQVIPWTTTWATMPATDPVQMVGQDLRTEATIGERSGEGSNFNREIASSSSGMNNIRRMPRANILANPSLTGGNGNRSGDDISRKKRSRIGEEAEGGGLENGGAGSALEELMERLEPIWSTSIRAADNRASVEVAIKKVSVEVTKLLSKLVQKQEENGFLLQQIVQLQSGRQGESRTAGPTYAEAARGGMAKDILEGRRLPVVQIPPTIKLAPAERTIIIKSQHKEGMASREKQQAFRKKLQESFEEDLAAEVTVVRPTRYGGFTVIAASEAARNKVAETIVEKGIVPEVRVVRPRKRAARMLCKNPPDTTPSDFLRNMYGRHNPELQKVPFGSRTAKISVIRMGWMFELSTAEAVACEAQNGRIRHSFGMEILLDEFIPLQQCYNCCNFGHEARNCQMAKPRCRLCGKDGHCGRECPTKDNRETWRCCVCRHHNVNKGTRLDTRHAAAQLHLCAVAAREKELRREQLRAAGVFVSARAIERSRTSGAATAASVSSPRQAASEVGNIANERTGNNSVSVANGQRNASTKKGANAQRLGRVNNGVTRNLVREGPRAAAEPSNKELRGEGTNKGVARARVRWGDEESGNEAMEAEAGQWSQVGRGGRVVRKGGSARPAHTPAARGKTRGGISHADESPMLSTPGTAVLINSEMDEDDFDF